MALRESDTNVASWLKGNRSVKGAVGFWSSSLMGLDARLEFTRL